MKSTDQFKKVISDKLQEMATSDPLFEKSLEKESKNIDDCITFILNSVKNSGCCGFSDDEIFGMAFHYYDEDNIDIGKPVSCKVVVNHSVEISEEETSQAKEEARNRIIQEEMERLRKKNAHKKSAIQPEVTQSSLF